MRARNRFVLSSLLLFCTQCSAYSPGLHACRRTQTVTMPASFTLARLPPAARFRTQRAVMFGQDVSVDGRQHDDRDEEARGLQLLCGAIGVCFGPLLVGTSLLGMVLGLLIATLVLESSGSPGLWGREIGFQVMKQLRALLGEVDGSAIRDLLASIRKQAGRLWRTVGVELKALDDALGASTRLAELTEPLKEKLQTCARHSRHRTSPHSHVPRTAHCPLRLSDELIVDTGRMQYFLIGGSRRPVTARA